MGGKVLMRKIYSKELKNEIIQWEEHCWKLFQKRMKPFCQKYKQKGVDIYLEQYWYNYNEKDSKENKTRIEFLPGYRYCCRYSFRKNGLIYKYFGNESACTVYTFVEIKRKKYYLNAFSPKCYVEMVFSDIFDEKYVAEDLKEWFDEIKTGDYILAEPINIYEYS